jgi:multidrug efflux pump subunit AcrA (membrane-fusion protein)
VKTEIKKKTPVKWLVLLCLLLLLIAVVWFLRRPKLVAVVNPEPVSMTETIASSARIGGVQESALGAQFSGTVEHLFVKAGDRVAAGQPIATLRNNVTQQQQVQARNEVATAQARLTVASKPPLPSELNEAAHQVTEAKAQLAQANAELELAARDFERGRQMFEQGLIPRNEFDRIQANRASVGSRVNTAKATVKVREARLETLKNTPRAEEVQVARAQLAEAQQALNVADEKANEAAVTAPFAGVITAVHAEQGQTVGAQGVVDLISDSLEIRVDLDESNLADLELGQQAILTSTAFGGQSFHGRLTDIGAAVDQARGIVTVKITADDPPDWLRPGQTVNVNIVTNETVERLVVPPTAVIHQGSRSVVLLVSDGHAFERAVLTRPAVDRGIPITTGLAQTDEVIVNPSGVNAGQAVRTRMQK